MLTGHMLRHPVSIICDNGLLVMVAMGQNHVRARQRDDEKGLFKHLVSRIRINEDCASRKMRLKADEGRYID